MSCLAAVRPAAPAPIMITLPFFFTENIHNNKNIEHINGDSNALACSYHNVMSDWITLEIYYSISTCADPENFVSGGPTLTTFFFS